MESQMPLINKSAKLMTKVFMSFTTLIWNYHIPHCPIWRPMHSAMYGILRKRKTRSYNITGQQLREQKTIRTADNPILKITTFLKKWLLPCLLSTRSNLTFHYISSTNTPHDAWLLVATTSVNDPKTLTSIIFSNIQLVKTNSVSKWTVTLRQTYSKYDPDGSMVHVTKTWFQFMMQLWLP